VPANFAQIYETFQSPRFRGAVLPRFLEDSIQFLVFFLETPSFSALGSCPRWRQKSAFNGGQRNPVEEKHVADRPAEDQPGVPEASKRMVTANRGTTRQISS
jgi:hypothetical protein